MSDPIDNKLVDKRVAHRYVRRGRLDEKEYEKHLKGLPDLAEQAMPVDAELEHHDFYDDEDEDDDLEAPEAPVAAAPATAPAPSPELATPSATPPSGTPDGTPPQGSPQA